MLGEENTFTLFVLTGGIFRARFHQNNDGACSRKLGKDYHGQTKEEFPRGHLGQCTMKRMSCTVYH